MARKILKYLIAICLVILTIFIILNPSPKDFKEFIGETSNEYYNLSFKRTHNYLIYSTYEFNYSVTESQEFDHGSEERTSRLNNLKGYYIGFLSNFKKSNSGSYYSTILSPAAPVVNYDLKDTSNPNSPYYRDR